MNCMMMYIRYFLRMLSETIKQQDNYNKNIIK